MRGDGRFVRNHGEDARPSVSGLKRPWHDPWECKALLLRLINGGETSLALALFRYLALEGVSPPDTYHGGGRAQGGNSRPSHWKDGKWRWTMAIDLALAECAKQARLEDAFAFIRWISGQGIWTPSGKTFYLILKAWQSTTPGTFSPRIIPGTGRSLTARSSPDHLLWFLRDRANQLPPHRDSNVPSLSAGTALSDHAGAATPTFLSSGRPLGELTRGQVALAILDHARDMGAPPGDIYSGTRTHTPGILGHTSGIPSHGSSPLDAQPEGHQRPAAQQQGDTGSCEPFPSTRGATSGREPIPGRLPAEHGEEGLLTAQQGALGHRPRPGLVPRPPLSPWMYGVVISTCVRAGEPALALAVADRIATDGATVGTAVYNMLVHACARGGARGRPDVARAWALLRAMHARTHSPSPAITHAMTMHGIRADASASGAGGGGGGGGGGTALRAGIQLAMDGVGGRLSATLSDHSPRKPSPRDHVSHERPAGRVSMLPSAGNAFETASSSLSASDATRPLSLVTPPPPFQATPPPFSLAAPPPKRKRSLTPNRFTYNSLLTVCAAAGDASRAARVLGAMHLAGVAPDTWTLNAAMSASAARGDVARAVRVMEAVTTWGGRQLVPDTVSFNVLMMGVLRQAAGRRRGDGWQGGEGGGHGGGGGGGGEGMGGNKVGAAPERARSGPIRTSPLGAPRKNADFLAALWDILARMIEAGCMPDTTTWNTLIQGRALAADTEGAVRLLSVMEEGQSLRFPVPPALPFSMLTSSSGHVMSSGRWGGGQVGRVAATPPAPPPDLVSYNLVMQACANAGDVDRGVQLVRHMMARQARQVGAGGGGIPRPRVPMPGADTATLGPDVITFNLLLAACRQAGRQDIAEQIMVGHVGGRMGPDSPGGNGGETGGGPAVGLMAQAGVEPDVVSHNTLLMARLEAGGRRNVDGTAARESGMAIMPWDEGGGEGEEGVERGEDAGGKDVLAMRMPETNAVAEGTGHSGAGSQKRAEMGMAHAVQQHDVAWPDRGGAQGLSYSLTSSKEAPLKGEGMDGEAITPPPRDGATRGEGSSPFVPEAAMLGSFACPGGADVPPDLWTYNSLVTTSGRSGDVRRALGLLHDMARRGIPPDAFTMCGLLTAVKNAGDRHRGRVTKDAWNASPQTSRRSRLQGPRAEQDKRVPQDKRAQQLQEREEVLLEQAMMGLLSDIRQLSRGGGPVPRELLNAVIGACGCSSAVATTAEAIAEELVRDERVRANGRGRSQGRVRVAGPGHEPTDVPNVSNPWEAPPTASGILPSVLCSDASSVALATASPLAPAWGEGAASSGPAWLEEPTLQEQMPEEPGQREQGRQEQGLQGGSTSHGHEAGTGKFQAPWDRWTAALMLADAMASAPGGPGVDAVTVTNLLGVCRRVCEQGAARGGVGGSPQDDSHSGGGVDAARSGQAANIACDDADVEGWGGRYGVPPGARNPVGVNKGGVAPDGGLVGQEGSQRAQESRQGAHRGDVTAVTQSLSTLHGMLSFLERLVRLEETSLKLTRSDPGYNNQAQLPSSSSSLQHTHWPTPAHAINTHHPSQMGPAKGSAIWQEGRHQAEGNGPRASGQAVPLDFQACHALGMALAAGFPGLHACQSGAATKGEVPVEHKRLLPRAAEIVKFACGPTWGHPEARKEVYWNGPPVPSERQIGVQDPGDVVGSGEDAATLLSGFLAGLTRKGGCTAEALWVLHRALSERQVAASQLDQALLHRLVLRGGNAGMAARQTLAQVAGETSFSENLTAPHLANCVLRYIEADGLAVPPRVYAGLMSRLCAIGDFAAAAELSSRLRAIALVLNKPCSLK
eukprot:jgi/Mesvir1/12961/Mv05973-RA.1